MTFHYNDFDDQEAIKALTEVIYVSLEHEICVVPGLVFIGQSHEAVEFRYCTLALCR